MKAEVKVNEALSGKIKAGQEVTVYSDALPDQALTGTVERVAVLAETGGWRDPNRRDYTVHVRLSNTAGLGLKPSMRCKANLHVGRVSNVLHIPVQAIFREGPVAYVYAPEGSGYAQTPVQVGRSSELYIEILGGLDAGDRVLLREPPTEQIVRTLDSSDAPAANAPPAVAGRGGPPPGVRGGMGRPTGS